MAEFVISERVNRFIVDCIDSLEQLETLLLLRSSGESLDAERVARELRSTPVASADYLKRLVAKNLVSSEASGGYKYSASSSVDETIVELEAVYRKAPYRIIHLIFSKPSDRVRSFADAFKLKKDGD